ncbi:hypothetical protein LPJ63_003802 [Coemansia sp. RSA 2711]|nr:hypothetical protein LPJ63_003802 [Coemansia sp. RSA 2711]KAJ2303308.1 hypothetical protein IWW54_005762 [Coemansia sp. RSA 2705]KAJ2316138.1 hypothetical protein IWW52_003794 [Coemansia sp. RSA 2704]KAJ2717698.1 hypothetical protein H4R23_005237 [Coemansia sp. Cherry 401B]
MRWIVATTLACMLAIGQIAQARLRTSSSTSMLNARSLSRSSAQCTSAVYLNTSTQNPPPMRTKQPKLCDPSVRQLSGYLDMDNDEHVFFWYFGSRARNSGEFNSTRDTVPLVFWFSGGPGCSSQIANWQENGPCVYAPSVPFPSGLSDSVRKRLPHSVQKNAFAWNAVADVVFIDQPVGTGFSHGPMPNSTEQAADTAWRAMQGIYAKLSKSSSDEAPISDVYVFGESYGGRYVPVFSEYLLHMNDQVRESEDLRDRGFVELPLRGIGIGNGLFDTRLQAASAHTMGCESSYPAIFTNTQCKYLADTVIPTCLEAIDKCYGSESPANSTEGMRSLTCAHMEPESWRAESSCAYADSYCNGALNWTTPVSTYDVRPGARMVPDDYVEYLRTDKFKQAVGVDEQIEFAECSDPVFDRFVSTADAMSRSSVSALEYMLDRGVPVLLYSGDSDFICNWYGTVAVARALRWKGREKLARASVVDWSWPAQSGKDIAAGQYINADNFTFLRVYEAGHEVPYYQPQAALYMLAQFLDRHKLY